LNREDFISDVDNINLDFSLYEKCKFTLIAMLALNPISDEVEKEAILSVLNYNHNIEAYIFDHLETEDVFYVVNKQFFDSWSMNVGF
jgi:hypothetical protein